MRKGHPYRNVRFFGIFLLLILHCAWARAQMVVLPFGSDHPGQVMVNVADAKTFEALEGALVSVTDGKDTLKLAIPPYGTEVFKNHFKTDSLTVTTEMMGYVTRRDRFPSDRLHESFWRILMEPDPQQLAQVVVTADAIAMVMNGDTTVFNSAAFNTLKGSALRDLLKQMPGITVDSDKVTYNGKKVDRILFNGTNIFGKDMKNAMDLVLAEEVKSVKVYDKQAVTDLEQDSDEAKEHVMDVQTWKPLQKVGAMILDAGGGIYTDRNELGKLDWTANAGLLLANYKQGDAPRVSGNLDYHRNIDTPMTAYSADVTVSKDIASKGGYRHSISISHKGNENRSGSMDLYKPGEDWHERADTSRISEISKSGQVFYIGGGYFRKNRTAVKISASGRFNLGRNFSENSSKSVVDAVSKAYRLFSMDTSRTGDFNVNTNIVQSFDKKSRKLSITMIIGGNFSSGTGGRIDTMATSINPMWQDKVSRSNTIRPKLNISWREPLGKKHSLVILSRNSYVYSKQRALFTDMLTGEMDMNNSKDFRTDYLCNSVELGWRYGRMNDGLYANVLVGMKNLLDGRNEALGNVRNWRKNYLRPVADATITYSKGPSSVHFMYRETENVPTAIQLRNVIDDSNGLYLSSGNPDLAMPVTRMVTAEYGIVFPESDITFKISDNGSLVSNAIVTRTMYFKTETYLPQYDYRVPAGASLVIPENVSGQFSNDLDLTLNKYFPKSKVTAKTNLRYSYVQSPFYMGEEFRRNINNSIRLLFPVEFAGKTLTFSLYPDVSLGRVTCNRSMVSDYLSLSGNLHYEQRFFDDRIALQIFGNAEKVFSTLKETEYFTSKVGLNLGYRFGPKKLSVVSIYADDVFNNVANIRNSVMTNYISHSYNSILGRNVGVSLILEFSKR